MTDDICELPYEGGPAWRAPITAALRRMLPAHYAIEVELVWEPPWTPERMSARVKRAMDWRDARH